MGWMALVVAMARAYMQDSARVKIGAPRQMSKNVNIRLIGFGDFGERL